MDDLDIATAVHRLVLAFQLAGLQPPEAFVLSDRDQLYRLESQLRGKHSLPMVDLDSPRISTIYGVELRVASY